MKQGWQIKKLGDLYPLKTGKTPSRGDASLWDTKKATNNLWVSIADISANEGKAITDTKEYISDKACDKFPMVPEGALLVSFKLSLGRMSFAGKALRTNEAILSLSPISEINQRFLYYYFLFFDWDKAAEGDVKVKGKTLNQKKLAEIPILYPSISEQQRIVSLLDAEFAKIDALKANATKNLQNAKDLFQAALKKELEPKEGWKSMLLGDFAKMKAGDFIKASDIHSDYYEGSFPCYGGNGLRGYVDVPNKEGEYCLIGRQGALCGNVHIANGVFRATEHAVVVEPYFSMPIKLVYYLLTALNLNKYSTGAAQPGLSVKNIAEKAMISIPPEEKYSIIAATLDGLSVRTQVLQANYEKTLSLCDDLKQALLRKAFNGEI